MEALIASALFGMVLALAMSGFMDINKVSNLTRSKTLGRQEAAKGLQEVTNLLKRAHIIYFTGRPLGVQTDIGQAQANNPVTAAIPDVLFTTLANGKTVQYLFASPADRSNLSIASASSLFGAAATRTRARFRFADASGPLLTFAANGNRLMTGDPSLTAAEDLYFPSPLAYWAEANFPTAPVGGRIRDSHLPDSWTVYVLYLAPMNLPFEHEALSYAGPPYNFAGDRGMRAVIAAGANQAASTYPRSTVPFELRLLTIPGIKARKTGAVPANHPADPAVLVAADASTQHILGAPFDHFRTANTTATLAVNYDPYAMPMRAGEDATLNRSVTRAGTAIFGSGERVNSGGSPGTNGGGIHANYNNLGNDPPTGPAIADRLAGPLPSDKVIASYIDPDSVNGTCIKLENNITPGVGNPWVNAYIGQTLATSDSGFRGHLYNTFTGVAGQGITPPPRRAYISITTRFRNNRRIPFQFATESTELELEALASYQSIERRKRE